MPPVFGAASIANREDHLKLFYLLIREATISPWLVIILACIAAIGNASILALINTVTEQFPELPDSKYIFLFAAVIGVYLVAQRWVLRITIQEVDAVLHRIRLRIIDKIHKAELMPLEKVGRADIYASMSKDMLTISNTSNTIASMCQSALLVIFTLGYIAWLSPLAFAVFVVGVVGGAGFFIMKRGSLSETIHRSMALENELSTGVTHLLDGFKEVKLNDRRGAALREHLGTISYAVMETKGHVTSQLAVANVLSQSIFYVLAASMVLVLPRISATNPETMVQLATGVLFLAGPIVTLVGMAQMYATANASAENIERLEAALDLQVRPAAQRKANPLALRGEPFNEIVFDNVRFEYHNADGQVSFTFGPTNLTIRRGELIFVTGGNGSGKSTFLRLLTCLYFPSKGAVWVDGQRLGEDNANEYRNLFSAIFFDYHLFDRLYGLSGVDDGQIDDLLDKLGLRGITDVVGDRFTTIKLSTGQKRRVALLISYLENRSICIFDEWAAEQDPEYRKYFYTILLPELKARGKTVIAVTHDDHYFHMDYIDRVIRLQEGRIVAENGPGLGDSPLVPG